MKQDKKLTRKEKVDADKIKRNEALKAEAAERARNAQANIDNEYYV